VPQVRRDSPTAREVTARNPIAIWKYHTGLACSLDRIEADRALGRIWTECNVCRPPIGEEFDDANASDTRRCTRPIRSRVVAAQDAGTATSRELCGINRLPRSSRSGNSNRTDRDALSGALRALEPGSFVRRRGNGLPVTSTLIDQPACAGDVNRQPARKSAAISRIGRRAGSPRMADSG
jgi:hypothetical protein